MFYKKYNKIDNIYIACGEKYDDSFIEMDDNLFDKGFDDCFYLKSFLEHPDE